VELAR